MRWGCQVLPRPVAIGLTVLISLMWAANLVVGFLLPGRSDPYVNAIFAIVCTAVYALGRKQNPQIRGARRRLADAIAGEPETEDEEADPSGEDEER